MSLVIVPYAAAGKTSYSPSFYWLAKKFSKKEAVLIKIPCLKNFILCSLKIFLLNMVCSECESLARGRLKCTVGRRKVFNGADWSTESRFLVPKLVTNIRVWKTKNQYTGRLRWRAGFKTMGRGNKKKKYGKHIRKCLFVTRAFQWRHKVFGVQTWNKKSQIRITADQLIAWMKVVCKSKLLNVTICANLSASN